MILMMAYFTWSVLAFLSGSLPFSVWLGKLFLDVDVRDFGDGNPGATNLFRAGSPLLGIITLILDVGKAALPVGICRFILGLHGPGLVLIALAPVLGHMFSPFLHFKGGKALATALGVWIGLTTWQASLPAVLGVVAGILIFSSPGWAVMLAMGVILLNLLVWIPDPTLLFVWVGQTALLAWSHRLELMKKPHLHQRWYKLLRKDPG
ncbi:MAG: glycerol-3-phosphate acyltransferase [Anaerolineales bacterium]|jgi:glycerol-3-phosphate acyltransferase PlsY